MVSFQVSIVYTISERSHCGYCSDDGERSVETKTYSANTIIAQNQLKTLKYDKYEFGPAQMDFDDAPKWLIEKLNTDLDIDLEYIQNEYECYCCGSWLKSDPIITISKSDYWD